MASFDIIFGKFKSKKIEIVFKNKVVKCGVLHTWKCHPFFFELSIDNGKTISKVKLFYPFKFEEYGDDINEEKFELYLDYRLSSFNNIVGMDFKIDDFNNPNFHKYFNGIVTINEV